MAQDREKSFKNAERLLKQGKVKSALVELECVAEGSPGDLLVLNRVGDLLVRVGRQAEAIVYYEKIAHEFSQGGFFPKAIAIHKKIQKINPGHVDSLYELGNLYLKQRLTGDARMHLTRAAKGYMEASNFTRAREVYERLVDADPNEMSHRLSLADARAAEGDRDRAAEELISIAMVQLEEGRPEEAEAAYRRAGELSEGNAGTISGLAFCLAAQDRHEEAIELLAARVRKHPELAGSMAVIYEIGGDGDRAAEIVKGTDSPEVLKEYIVRVVRHSTARARTSEAWENVDTVLEKWGTTERTHHVLSGLVEAEDDGHVPALERLYLHHCGDGNRKAAVEILERLIKACRAHSMNDEAERFEAELAKDFPEIPQARPAPARVAPPARPAPPAAPAAPAAQTKTTPSAGAPSGGGDVEWLLRSAEAPAVPLAQEDLEFVEGHMTEAEVLQKYGLVAEALERLREVTTRFPGHVAAQEKLAAVVRGQGDRPMLTAVLVQLACARRAAGDVSGAREAAREAERKGPLADDLRKILESLSLVGREDGAGAKAAAAPAATTQAPEPAAAPEKPVAIPAPEPPPASAAAAVVESAPAGTAPEAAADVEIEFSEEPAAAEPAVTERVANPPPADPPEVIPTAENPPVVAEPRVNRAPEQGPAVEGAKTPPADVVEEISFYIEQGMIAEARGRLNGLKSQGFAGPALERLQQGIDRAAFEPAAAKAEAEEMVEIVDDPAPGPAGASVRLDEEELDELTAALEAELSNVAAGDAPGEVEEEGPSGEESLDEAFEAFKQQVDHEVGKDDFRTHYDLGIAYKEMGLVEDAIREFEIAIQSSDIFREACTMLAICERERGETEIAVTWYRKAIDATGVGDEHLAGLQYDLAEVLVESGDSQEALDLFESVHRATPGYRDVQERISELQTRTGT
jgi:tetratricopeptide (TPR) repeat protein